ncbi:hypothetical protein F4825DRAFT_402286 [Nemania diffusa]|nr:hypothetical protein F4825DRAFT_402286 [Nemania diffusa]
MIRPSSAVASMQQAGSQIGGCNARDAVAFLFLVLYNIQSALCSLLSAGRVRNMPIHQGSFDVGESRYCSFSAGLFASVLCPD